MIYKFYKWGIYGNRWLWFHLYAGCFGYWLAGNIGLSLGQSVITIAALAVGWEIIEYFLECGGNPEKIIEIYGSLERWAYDTAGDIIVPLVLGVVFWWRF